MMTPDFDGWHYHPVYIDEPGGKTFSLCEVYLTANGKLASWTETRAIAPQGATISDLSCDLATMILDANRWKPVAFIDLKVGMTFEAVGDGCDPLSTRTSRHDE